MKKTINIVFINIFFIVIIFFLIDEIANCIQFYHPKYWEGYDTSRIENSLPYDKDKKSIFTLGCSFTFGNNIEADETISYKLQKLTKRKVYNKGQSTWGPQFVLRDIQQDEYFNGRKIVEPEYFIYTFISDHIRRIYCDYFFMGSKVIYNLYSIKDNKLVLNPQKVRPINYFQVTTIAKEINWLTFNMTSDNDKFDRLKLYLLTMKDELNKRFPDSKFVVVVYNSEADTEHNNIKPFKTDRWSELEQDGIIVIRFDTPEYNFLTEKEYLASDGQHPSAKAWDRLVPVIAQKLNLVSE